MSTDNGGPAFPNISDSAGMTLRDYFAAKAMQGDMARVEWTKDKADDYASWAYIMADAMLKARGEG